MIQSYLTYRVHEIIHINLLHSVLKNSDKKKLIQGQSKEQLQAARGPDLLHILHSPSFFLPAKEAMVSNDQN